MCYKYQFYTDDYANIFVLFLDKKNNRSYYGPVYFIIYKLNK